MKVILFDRDGTLIVNVPYNGDPGQVVLMPTAAKALAMVRTRGCKIGIVSNQSGVGRGFISMQDVWAVNRRVEQLLGSVDGWFLCPHAPADHCSCRKPHPTLILDALRHFGASPHDGLLIGDQGSDIQAAQAAGVRAILVPGPDTSPQDLAVSETAPTLLQAVTRAFEINRLCPD